MNTTKWGARWAVGLVVMAMVAGGCASGDDVAAESDLTTTTESSGQEPVADQPNGGSAAGNVDCLFLGEQRVALQTYANMLLVIKNEESFNSGFGTGDLDAMETAIEAFRPYQDIDTIFGPLKEGLDNLSTDLAAARAGEFQFGEHSGPYNVAGFSAIFEELDC